jgi:hypothetical protein
MVDFVRPSYLGSEEEFRNGFEFYCIPVLYSLESCFELPRFQVPIHQGRSATAKPEDTKLMVLIQIKARSEFLLVFFSDIGSTRCKRC